MFLFSYGLIAVLYLVSDTIGWQYLSMATKPLLLSTLFFYFLWSTKNRQSFFFKSILFALFFSFLGDSFLLFEGELFFILGLGSFLITHLCYTFAFRKIATDNLSVLLLRNKLAVVFFVLLFVFLLMFLWSDLGALRWPVLVYGVAISIMGLAAFLLKSYVSPWVFNCILMGALLFIFSDSMIALNKFKSTQLNLPFPGLLVMVPYILAQLLIVEGSIQINNQIKSIS